MYIRNKVIGDRATSGRAKRQNCQILFLFFGMVIFSSLSNSMISIVYQAWIQTYQNHFFLNKQKKYRFSYEQFKTYSVIWWPKYRAGKLISSEIYLWDNKITAAIKNSNNCCRSRRIRGKQRFQGLKVAKILNAIPSSQDVK